MPEYLNHCLCARCAQEINDEAENKRRMCARCYKVFPISSYPNKTKCSFCKSCYKQAKRKTREKGRDNALKKDEIYLKTALEKGEELFQCTACKVDKPVVCYSPSLFKKKARMCRVCHLNAGAHNAHTPHNTTRMKNIYAPEGKKWCKHCLQYLDINQFYYHKKTGVKRAACDACHSKLNNRNKIKKIVHETKEIQGSFYEIWKQKYEQG